jgi:signal transduction histidine kinase
MSGFLLYSPISIISVPVSLLVVNENVAILELTVLGIILSVMSLAIYLILIKLFKLITPSLSLTYIAFFGIPLITGIFRGHIFFQIVEFTELNQPSSLISRILGSTLTTLFWLPLANYVINSSRQFKVAYQSAMGAFLHRNAEGVGHTKMTIRTASDLNAIEAGLKASISQHLGSSDTSQFLRLSEVLTQQINEEIRPLSERIWLRNIAEYPKVHFFKLIRDALKFLTYSPKSFLWIMGTLSLLSNLAFRSFFESTLRTVSFLLASFLLFRLRRLINDHISAPSTFQNLCFLFILGAMPILFSEFLSIGLGYSGDWIATLLVTPIAPVVVLVMSLLHLTKQDRKTILNTIESLSIVPEFESFLEVEAEKASIATYLHNSLQSELLALSKQLEDAAKEVNPVKSAELLQRVSSLVNRSIVDDYSKFAESPLKRLESVVASWAGILDIKVDLAQLKLCDERLHRTIVQTIEEVATNSVRHGNANLLRVSLDLLDDEVILSFQSNGSNELVKRTGRGSAWLDNVATSGWKIEKNSQGTLLTVVL